MKQCGWESDSGCRFYINKILGDPEIKITNNAIDCIMLELDNIDDFIETLNLVKKEMSKFYED